MAKQKSEHVCGSCGFVSAKWLGRCPDCGEWNTFSERAQETKGVKSAAPRGVYPTRLSEIVRHKDERIETGINELDRVLSGGVVNGSLTLIAGDPGIGKSTLLLQICQKLGEGHKILYVSGEESAAQIKMRADRLGVTSENLYLLAETNIEAVSEAVDNSDYSFLLVDSIQTMQTDAAQQAAGSVTQVRECTSALMRLGKRNNIAVIIVGHATKEGTIAGPKILEHMVDTVLWFEGERYLSYRILRAVKNRFGSVNEIGVFEMSDNGLKEIENPSEYLLSGRSLLPGSVVTPVMEGSRPILTEVQALVANTAFPMPKRSAIGLDYNRVMLLVAVLEKRLMLKLGVCDVYVNVAGGIRIAEPAADMAVIAAVLSSYRNKQVDGDTAFFGEVGLSGEIRAVAHAEKRVNEAFKLGFKRCVVPSENAKKLRKAEITGVSNVREFFDIL